MVIKVNRTKYMRQVLSYNEKKVAQKDAKILFAAGFPSDPATLNLQNKMEVFTKLTRQNQRIKANTLHISLNFSPEDQLDRPTLVSIARDYLQAIGLGRQPYLIYQHLDAGHPHLHIASVIIDHSGKRIETFEIDIRKPKALRDALENKYGLTKMEAHRISQKVEASDLKALHGAHLPGKSTGQPLELKRVAYGTVETKAAICSIVTKVVKHYKFSNLNELNAILNQFGVMADRGRPGSHLHQVGGLLYRLLDDNNRAIGTPVKASKITGRPTLKNLESRYAINIHQIEANRQRIRYWLDKTIFNQNQPQGNDPNQIPFHPQNPRLNQAIGQGQNPGQRPDQIATEEMLRKNGIRIVLQENSAGKVIGVTFIDNAAPAACSGESLGEYYGVEAILKALKHQNITGRQNIPTTGLQQVRTGAQVSDLTRQPGSTGIVGAGRRLQRENAAQNKDSENTLAEQNSTTPTAAHYPASSLPVIQTFTLPAFLEQLAEENRLSQAKQQQAQRASIRLFR